MKMEEKNLNQENKEEKKLTQENKEVELIDSQADVWVKFFADNHYSVSQACQIMACFMVTVFGTIKKHELTGFLYIFWKCLVFAFESGFEFDEKQKTT